MLGFITFDDNLLPLKKLKAHYWRGLSCSFMSLQSEVWLAVL